MKPNESKPDTIFRLFDRETGRMEGAYSRAYCTEYDFRSAEEARRANCNDIFQDKAKYRVAKYRVTYELVEEDVDPPSEAEIAKAKADAEWADKVEAEMDDLGLKEWDRVSYRFNQSLKRLAGQLLTRPRAGGPL